MANTAVQLVDTHCHIQSAGAAAGERSTREKWAKVPDRTPEAIIQSAARNGVTKMICVGCDLADSQLAVDFVQNRPECWASIGIHPHEAEKYLVQGHSDAFRGLVARPKVIAVGECGLDYYYEHSPREAQIQVLRMQIELALEHGLPMIFHVREAFDDFWPIFDSYSGVCGVLHSFTDSSENLDRALSKGLYIGVNGIATFAKDATQIDMYTRIPLSSLVLETDAPYLAPVPFRGKRNEPAYIRYVAEKLAEITEKSVEEIGRITTRNAENVFI